MNRDERTLAIEAALSAHRHRDADGNPQPPPVWWDLPADALDELFEAQLAARELERHENADGVSTTVRAVQMRLRLAL